MALITIRTATLDAGAAFLEITYDALPTQRNRRVELRDLREFGFGGQAVA